MRILGIDPGTATTGWGVVEKVIPPAGGQVVELVDFGCITTAASLPLANRIEVIYDQIQELIAKWQPTILSVESVFFNTNAKTAMLVGQARGAVLLAGRKTKLEIMEFTPLQVKMAVTGYGRADKNQVQQMVKLLLKLDQIPKPDDAADALAVGIAAAFTNKEFLA